MADPWWGDDERLLAELGRALRAAASVPPEVVDAAKATYTWRDIDSELATLAYDSALDDVGATRSSQAAPPGLTDGGDEPGVPRSDQATLRAMTFVAAALTIEIEVTGGALLGQLVPPQAGEVEVRAGSGSAVRAPVDEVGCFVIRPIPSGPFRLYCRTANGDVLTDRLRL